MMPKHRKSWQDDGMVGIESCGNTPIDLTLTAPDGPMGGDEGDDYYARECPNCGARLILRWSVRVEQLPGRPAPPTPGHLTNNPEAASRDEHE